MSRKSDMYDKYGDIIPDGYTVSDNTKRMTNEEAIAVLKSELDGIPSDIDKSEFEQALDVAIKAIRIFEVIEDGFKRDSNLIMDSDDWKDIKAFTEKEAKNE